LGWMQRGCSVGLWKGHLHGYSQTVTWLKLSGLIWSHSQMWKLVLTIG
jgi:hypothetical protein